jgi:hypothetical protein
MASRVVAVASHAFGEPMLAPSRSTRVSRRYASWTMSSASLTLPVIRYAMENISGRYSV